MKRLWLGAGLLLSMLAIGLGSTALVLQSLTPISENLDEAVQAVQVEDWQRAQALVSDAFGQWQQRRKLTAALTYHEPLRQIDSLFAQLAVYARQKDVQEYAAMCAQLARLTDGVRQENKLTWWTLL